ncbi:MAG: AAA family ATPase [Hallerella succinigenes]|uniref:AAA family ATPase n=1 Tax=Hallerella succinigenes TaxID=1896222 RepID=UPI0023F53D72|nr:AAA family ATPase [Hallerella succinigenes]MDD6091826.1 AAA family ATPase [Hallerella succinigenes]
MSIGGITYKTINGKRYAYYQWTENGKQRSRRVKDEEFAELAAKIAAERAQKESLRGILQGVVAEPVAAYSATPNFKTDVKIGAQLPRFFASVMKWKKRECFAALHDYIYSENNDRVLILYGLRRTGKTTLVRQLMGEMPAEMLAKTAFVQLSSRHSLADVNHDLKLLESLGYRYVFIDEVTMLSDFIEGAALFSDVFAAGGMKVVLSGTDSLGFVFSEDEQLYDRCILLHTTFIPYREFENVLGVAGIDKFIEFGGTMSMGGANYNMDKFTFATKESADDYVDSAIARNIQHSLKCYQHEGHFRSLQELYDAGELTNAINRIVEDVNHRFTIEVLTRKFKSGDLRRSAQNLRRDRFKPTDILDRVDIGAVTKRLKHILQIRDKAELSVGIGEANRAEIKEYLDLLDLTCDIDVVNMSNLNARVSRTVLSQPGLRYAQASALIQSLLLDETFRNIPIAERMSIEKRILDEIRGRMMEEIVLLETKMARPGWQVFQLQFAVGEFDMVVFDPKNACCEIYEIKHSDRVAREQCRHLLDAKKCADTEFRYGKILNKNIIYRGPAGALGNINYLNVEDYLKGLA